MELRTWNHDGRLLRGHVLHPDHLVEGQHRDVLQVEGHLLVVPQLNQIRVHKVVPPVDQLQIAHVRIAREGEDRTVLVQLDHQFAVKV